MSRAYFGVWGRSRSVVCIYGAVHWGMHALYMWDVRFGSMLGEWLARAWVHAFMVWEVCSQCVRGVVYLFPPGLCIFSI